MTFRPLLPACNAAREGSTRSADQGPAKFATSVTVPAARMVQSRPIWRSKSASEKGLRDRLKAAAEAHPGKRIALWFMDEARVGQKGRLCHRW
jgi:hypothetical protein